jgi:hypothetical protein
LTRLNRLNRTHVVHEHPRVTTQREQLARDEAPRIHPHRLDSRERDRGGDEGDPVVVQVGEELDAAWLEEDAGCETEGEEEGVEAYMGRGLAGAMKDGMGVSPSGYEGAEEKAGGEEADEEAGGRIEESTLSRHDRLDVERDTQLRGRRAARARRGETEPNRTEPCSPFMV